MNWTKDLISLTRDMCDADCGDDWEHAAVAFRRQLRSALDEIERLQAALHLCEGEASDLQNDAADGDEAIRQHIRRDHRLEMLLREAEAMLIGHGGSPVWIKAAALAARIRAELEP